jgi:hypothetical protein
MIRFDDGFDSDGSLVRSSRSEKIKVRIGRRVAQSRNKLCRVQVARGLASHDHYS